MADDPNTALDGSWFGNTWDRLTTNLTPGEIPLLNTFGHQWGYANSAQDLANGKVYAYQGETLPARSDWRVAAFFGNLVTVEQYLIGRGLQPSWLTTDQAQTIKTQQNKDDSTFFGVDLNPNDYNWDLNPFDWIGGNPFDNSAAPKSPLSGLSTADYVMFGSFGLLALVLVLRRPA